MSSSLIRGKYVICKALSRTEVETIEDGAIFQQDGKIVEIGKYTDLAAKYQPEQVLGSLEHVVIPGLINSHHHMGLTPFQLGSLDAPLESWLTNRLGERRVDAYLDTLYSAFEMIESGVTTVQHLQDWLPDSPSTWDTIANQVIGAYQDIGMRVCYCVGIREQNHAVYEANAAFIKHLPSMLASEIAALLQARETPIQTHLDFFENLWHQWDRNENDCVRIQLCPANLQWCSDESLEGLYAYAVKYDAGIHMHLLETAYQKVYAHKRLGKTAVHHLQDLGILGPHLTLAHGVWLTENDIERVAETGTRICHNASSNLRLQSGIAPLNEYVRQGVTVSMGIDEAGINDDRDMLQEMRLVLKLHRVPGISEFVPTSPQVFQMATENGAKTTGFERHIGTLEVGKAADLVVMNWKHISYPYLDMNIPVIDAILHRSRLSGIEIVMIGGEIILQDGKFSKIDKEAALAELADCLSLPQTTEEFERCELFNQLTPYVKKFYESWLNGSKDDPFYHQNGRL